MYILHLRHIYFHQHGPFSALSVGWLFDVLVGVDFNVGIIILHFICLYMY